MSCVALTESKKVPESLDFKRYFPNLSLKVYATIESSNVLKISLGEITCELVESTIFPELLFYTPN